MRHLVVTDFSLPAMYKMVCTNCVKLLHTHLWIVSNYINIIIKVTNNYIYNIYNYRERATTHSRHPRMVGTPEW